MDVDIYGIAIHTRKGTDCVHMSVVGTFPEKYIVLDLQLNKNKNVNDTRRMDVSTLLFVKRSTPYR